MAVFPNSEGPIFLAIDLSDHPITATFDNLRIGLLWSHERLQRNPRARITFHTLVGTRVIRIHPIYISV